MPEAWDDLDEIGATFAAMPVPSRLAMAAEFLEWTVLNFSTPIADPVVGDVVARAAMAIRDAVGRGATAGTGPEGFTSEIFDVADEAQERGAYELLLAHYCASTCSLPRSGPTGSRRSSTSATRPITAATRSPRWSSASPGRSRREIRPSWPTSATSSAGTPSRAW